MTSRPAAARTRTNAALDTALALAVSQQGVFHVDPLPEETSLVPAAIARRIADAFARGSGSGLLHLATVELTTDLPPSIAFGRDLAKRYFTKLSAVSEPDAPRARVSVPAPEVELAELVAAAPPMTGAEYLSVENLAAAWIAIEAEVQLEIAAFGGTLEAYLHTKSPLWNVVGRVVLHLAENKRSEQTPFAFLATYATRLSREARVQHAPLGKAVAEYAGDSAKLYALLAPVQRAAEKSPFVRRLVDSGEIFHPIAWTPKEAYAFLQDIPALERSGVVVRVPDWWRARRPPKARVNVTIGGRTLVGVGADAMLDFNVDLTLDGVTIEPEEWSAILSGTSGLRLMKGKWVEVDVEKLREALDHWRHVERAAKRGGISFFDGMRMLSGAGMGSTVDSPLTTDVVEWAKVTAGPWLERLLADLQHPEATREADPGDDLKGTLRPYQRAGVAWLWLLSRLGLGACLADDMGLGKTIQVLALLLLLKKRGERGPHILVVPASLLGNWLAEMKRFAPSLRPFVAHPSAAPTSTLKGDTIDLPEGTDVVLTTYGTVLRAPWIRGRRWGVVALDEAQAIKNPGAKQTRAVKGLMSTMRLAMTGTPVENRLGDLWSLFDFLCPGLLGSAQTFSALTRKLGEDPARGYAPLRELVRPYILRRMKSDRAVVQDLPDKTEVRAFCPLTKVQAALYSRAVTELDATLNDDALAGIQRRGVVLAYLTRFKQICNHPSQWLGDGVFNPADSGKLARLRELGEAIAARQEKVLVFTQFREMTGPLASFLESIFGRAGLVLHGETRVKDRADLVAEFQREGGPPFFVLSLKAGGTGLNLTAASHVVHFDRWWNPAVENQATDRAYRIGQKRNVLVHKFVCRGTIEEKVDQLIEGKKGLSEEILAGGGEAWLTEMKSDELLRMVSLDARSALAEDE